MSRRSDLQKVRYIVLRHRVRDEPQSRRTLEIFPRALYASYLRHRDEPCTADLFCVLLEDGFTGEPAAFDPAWLHFLDKQGTDDLVGVPISRERMEQLILQRSRIAPRERFERLILRQIADLHVLTPEELENIDRYMGGRAPSGQTWQHANLADFLYMASDAPAYGLPLELGRGRERHGFTEVDVIYTEEPEQELARLEALFPFDGAGGTQPVGAGQEQFAPTAEELNGEDGDVGGSFGWEDIEDFLWVGQEME